MFDPLKKWLENLFQGITRSSRDGTYIERTPTLLDTPALRGLIQRSINVSSNPGVETAFYLLVSSTDRPIYIRYLSVQNTLNCDWLGYQISAAPGITGDEISKLSQQVTTTLPYYQLITGSDYIIVPPGKNLYGVLYDVGAAQRSGRFQVQYLEVPT